MRLFRKTTLPTFELKEFPKGTFLQTEEGFFYVFSKTQRYRFTTKRVLDSWGPQRVVRASEADEAVKKMKVITKMKFRDNSLLYSLADGKLYLVSDRKLRHVISPDAMNALGLRLADAVYVSPDEINLHEKGAPLSG